MIQQPINYKDVIDLGFNREESADTIWYNQHGYEYFTVEKKLAKRILATWDIETRTVELLRIDREHTILHRVPVEDLDHLKLYLGLFDKPVKDEDDD